MIAIGMMILNNALFTHTHKVADGTSITHAHPFDRTSDSAPFKSHHHTKTEYQFFQQLEILFLFLGIILGLIVLLSSNKTLVSRSDFTSFIAARVVHGRAPPTL